ncbi:hypothetical protein BYT27DRAFT_7113063 [Phlegmacium glaucopus]|nr:hypothetical protein BYT27DRAFT_7113063 [Phlegmacium glaucopus]
MSASRSQRDIWHRRVPDSQPIIVDLPQVSQAAQDCQFNSGNNIFSCFPTADTIVPQAEWATFVWNSNRPDITQINLVDIFLFHADTQEQILHLPNQSNPIGHEAGVIRAQVNDSWFGTDGLNWSGSNVSYPYYWVIIRSDRTLAGNQVPQTIFTAVQTTVLDSVAAASSSSAAAASITSITSASIPTGYVQHATPQPPFPPWAIAAIVLGFLAIVATCIFVFLILRCIRRRRETDSNRNSMGSASPMIARGSRETQETNQRCDSPSSPLLPRHTRIPAVATGVLPPIATRNLTTDAASNISDSGGPLSCAESVSSSRGVKVESQF